MFKRKSNDRYGNIEYHIELHRSGSYYGKQRLTHDLSETICLRLFFFRSTLEWAIRYFATVNLVGSLFLNGRRSEVRRKLLWNAFIYKTPSNSAKTVCHTAATRRLAVTRKSKLRRQTTLVVVRRIFRRLVSCFFVFCFF